MFVTLKMFLHALLPPPASPLLLAVAGLLLIWGKRRRLGATLLAVGLACLWLCSVPVVSNALWRLAERYPALDLNRPTNAQAIVILGGGGYRYAAPEYGGPAPELALLDRLTYGAFVARRTSLPVLVSGNGNEAGTMRASLTRDFGISTRWFENHSRDTFENARFSAQILRADGVNRIILVTTSTHLWRASQEFRNAGLEVVPAPVGVWAVRGEGGFMKFMPSAAALLRTSEAVSELIGEPVRVTLAALHLRRQSG
jgi:uncharacterized SAM-binding protein YcdF (DUF218 family)